MFVTEVLIESSVGQERFSKGSLRLVFCLSSQLLTSGRFRSCSCSWKKPGRRSRNCGNRYVLTAAMLWERGGALCSLRITQSFAQPVMCQPNPESPSGPKYRSTHTGHRCLFLLPHTQTIQASFNAGFSLFVPFSLWEIIPKKKGCLCQGHTVLRALPIETQIPLNLSTYWVILRKENKILPLELIWPTVSPSLSSPLLSVCALSGIWFLACLLWNCLIYSYCPSLCLIFSYLMSYWS